MNVDSLTLWCHGHWMSLLLGWLLMGWLLMGWLLMGLVVDDFGC